MQNAQITLVQDSFAKVAPIKDAWITAYTTLSGVMIDAAYGTEAA
jgi:hypothetical protein